MIGVRVVANRSRAFLARWYEGTEAVLELKLGLPLRLVVLDAAEAFDVLSGAFPELSLGVLELEVLELFDLLRVGRTFDSFGRSIMAVEETMSSVRFWCPC